MGVHFVIPHAMHSLQRIRRTIHPAALSRGGWMEAGRALAKSGGVVQSQSPAQEIVIYNGLCCLFHVF